MKIVWLWTDVVLWLLLASLLVYAWRVGRTPQLRTRWRRVFGDPATMSAAVVLAAFLLVALLDSFHFRRELPSRPGAGSSAAVYAARVESVLDVLLQPLVDARENSYSQPLAWQGFVKETQQLGGGQTRREFPRLTHGGASLSDPATQWAADVARRTVLGLGGGAGAAGLLWVVAAALRGRSHANGWRAALADLAANRTELPWRAALVTASVLSLLVGVAVSLSSGYHLLGTDRTGNDVLYQSLKSVRTAFVIASLTQLALLPFAITLGIMAGYFKGWVDTVIEYIYTTVSSVPDILLIAAFVLMVQVYLDTHPELFETGLERADLKIFLLCVIIGVTGWAGLCRLLRAETLKLREQEFVLAARAFGVGPWRIMRRHILPNVLHLVLITSVLQFSSLILYEAVLSYVGVGVDPAMNSYGGMINSARVEMSRDPVVWWSFAAAFAFMVALVLAANLFADGVRAAFDPRGATPWRTRRGLPPASPRTATAVTAKPAGSSGEA